MFAADFFHYDDDALYLAAPVAPGGAQALPPAAVTSSRHDRTAATRRGRFLTVPWVGAAAPAAPVLVAAATTARRQRTPLTRRGRIFIVPPAQQVATPGSVLSITIGSDGWYADIVFAGLATGGTYAFGLGTNNDPAAGTPVCVFTAISLGFTAAGNATTVTRTIYGTKQVRQPYPNAALNQETSASGNVTVRVALSDYIYSGDTSVTATFLAGLYTSASTPSLAVSALGVTNSSTHAYPKVVGNWSWPGFTKHRSTFPVRCVAYHRSASGGKPVQCVKFTATDQHANTVSSIITAPIVDGSIGDVNPITEYVATIDSSTLIQGDLLTFNFIAYPIVGDAAACLDTSAGTAAPTALYGPITGICDKTAAYAPSVAVVDSILGNDGTGAVTAAFDVNSPPLPFLTIAAAFTALRTYNNANFSRNNAGGSVIYLKDGSYAWIGGSVTLGTTPDVWLLLTKYPTSVRSNVFLASQSGGFSLGLRVKIQDVTITAQSASGVISAGAGSALWIDRCDVNCPIVNQPTFYVNSVWYTTRSLITSLGTGFTGFGAANTAPALIRGNTVLSTGHANHAAYTVIGNSMPAGQIWQDSYIGQVTPTTTNTVFAHNNVSGAVGSNTPVLMRQTTTDTHGLAIVQNLIEITATTGSNALGVAGDATTQSPVNNVMIWNNVVVGQRCNLAYNEVDTGSGGGLAVRLGWSVRDNIFDDANIKSDTFVGAGFLADGAKVGNWSFLYGCACSGNFYAETTGIGAPGQFLWEMPGLKSYQPAATGQPPQGTSNAYGYIQYVNPKAYTGTVSGAGGGDYHLAKTSPVATAQRDFVMPMDYAGSPRAANDPAGLYALTSPVPVNYLVGSHGRRRYAAIRRGQFSSVPSVSIVAAPAWVPSFLAPIRQRRIIKTRRGTFAAIAFPGITTAPLVPRMLAQRQRYRIFVRRGVIMMVPLVGAPPVVSSRGVMSGVIGVGSTMSGV